MNFAVVPETPKHVTEPVDPPEVVREKAGVERTAILVAESTEKLRSFNRQVELSQAGIKRLRRFSLLPMWALLHRAKKRRLMADCANLKARLRPLVTAAEQLARYTSGLIENARIPQIDKIELQLRNAELEAELIEARHLIG